MENINTMWNLQMFAEGGEGAAAPVGETAGTQGGEQQPAADTAPAQEKMSFDELLNDADYKKAFDNRVRNAIRNRFKSVDAERAQMAPMLQTLGRKYGLDVSDPGKIDLKRLSEAVMADDAMLEKEAADMGLTVDGLRMIRSAERERDEAVRVREEEASQRAWEHTLAEAEQLRQIYPNFDLATEMENPAFQKLLINNQMAGIDNAVRNAYQVIHMDEIMSGAMAYAVQKTKQQVSNNIQAGQQRPAENGNAAPAKTKIDIAHMTREQRAEIRKRVMNGEHITFQ